MQVAPLGIQALVSSRMTRCVGSPDAGGTVVERIGTRRPERKQRRRDGLRAPPPPSPSPRRQPGTPTVGRVAQPNPRNERRREPTSRDETDDEGAKAPVLMHVQRHYGYRKTSDQKKRTGATAISGSRAMTTADVATAGGGHAIADIGIFAHPSPSVGSPPGCGRPPVDDWQGEPVAISRY